MINWTLNYEVWHHNQKLDSGTTEQLAETLELAQNKFYDVVLQQYNNLVPLEVKYA